MTTQTATTLNQYFPWLMTKKPVSELELKTKVLDTVSQYVQSLKYDTTDQWTVLSELEDLITQLQVNFDPNFKN